MCALIFTENTVIHRVFACILGLSSRIVSLIVYQFLDMSPFPQTHDFVLYLYAQCSVICLSEKTLYTLEIVEIIR